LKRDAECLGFFVGLSTAGQDELESCNFGEQSCLAGLRSGKFCGYESCAECVGRGPCVNYGLEEAGMAQLDDSVGALMKALDDMGEANNTIVVFSTDNGAETFTWPDGGITPFRASKGTIHEGGFRVPAIIRWPGHVKPGTVENGLFSGLDWYPTFVAAAGNPNITQQLLQGVRLGDQTYKNHLDGYNQMALLEGKGPSARHELFYFGGAELGAVRVDNFKYQFYTQPEGWPGPKVAIDMPLIYNIRNWPG
jgi:arylsulfatase A-like enzyme